MSFLLIDDETTASGRPFQTSAAATGKVPLPTVDSLMGSATRQLVYLLTRELVDRAGQRRQQEVADIVARCREE